MGLLIVLVLYEMDLDETPTFRSLRRCLERLPRNTVHLLIYDNSKKTRCPDSYLRELPFSYFHDPANGGLASAYNAALAMAVERDAAWVMLLDQDSDLPEGFVREILDSIEGYGDQADVAAIVPKVLGAHSSLSPKEVHLGYLTDLKNSVPGRCEREITAINSGLTVRTSFMTRVGGFNRTYWLDFMDYWLFKTIYRKGSVAVLSGASFRHSLSLETRTISSSRYLNMLKAESTFVLQEGRAIEVPLHVIRLFARALKNLFVRGEFRLAWITARMAFKMIWSTRQSE